MFRMARKDNARGRLKVVLAATLTAGLLPFAAHADTPLDKPQVAKNFDLVGQNPLFGRGMNAAPALYNDTAANRTFLYVGSRTDSSNRHPHAGVMVVDATDPSSPQVVNEIGAPYEGKIGETSRELRVWPEAKLLMVLHFTCSSIIHACDPVTDNVSRSQPNIVFYDLTDPAHPAPVVVYKPAFTPHEIFMWTDPAHAGRALLYMSAPTSSTSAANLIVADISGAATPARTQPVLLAQWNANSKIDATDRQKDDVRLHSMSVTPDGTRAYLAYLGAGFLVLDTSALTNPAVTPPVALNLRTAPADRPHWGNPGTHSAVKIPFTKLVDGVQRTYAMTTDEVYGESSTPLQAGKGRHGCPWGWVRTLDITDETRPTVVGEYKIAANDPASCADPRPASGTPTADNATTYVCDFLTGIDPTAPFVASYASHNPTVLRDLAFVTWHSGGLQAIDLSDPVHPAQAGEFLPKPLSSVATEDPALSSGLSKVVMWSYPVLNRQNGQTYIYVVDVRNGLYVLRYTGPHAASVNDVSFLEGNSTLGDAANLDGYVPPVGPPPTGAINWTTTAANTFHFDSSAPVGEANRVAQFGGAGTGPSLTRTAPTGATKVQSTSRFGNAGLAANPLLAYFTYPDKTRFDGTPQLHLWLTGSAATGVARLPLGVEVFIDGQPQFGAANAAGSWVPISFPVTVGPTPTEVTLTLPYLKATALDNVLVQLSVTSGTTDTNPKDAAILYGSPTFDSWFQAPSGFPQ